MAISYKRKKPSFAFVHLNHNCKNHLGKVGKNGLVKNFTGHLLMLVVGIMKIIKLVNFKNTFGLGWLKMDMTNKIS